MTVKLRRFSLMVVRLTNDDGRAIGAGVQLQEAPDGDVVLWRDVEARDADAALHPTGRCTCAGEARCEWCRAAERGEEREASE